MSGVVGKNSKSLTKQNVTESKLAQQGIKNLRMFHKATKGDTAINLGALIVPSELVGFAGNPSPSSVLSSIVSQQVDNIQVKSSINQELMQNLTWVISGSSINFINGYSAEEGEIFEILINNRIVNGNTVVDARPLGTTGTLLTGTTVFNVGTAYEVNANSGAQVGSIMVFKDGILQHRKVGNVSSGEGNYIEVPTVANGKYGSTIDFGDAEDVDCSIQIVSVGLIAEKPTVSQMQQIENLAGRIDKLVPTVAQLAGVPETDFQSAPSNQDLKAFGDQVLDHENRIDALEVKTKKFQTKKLNSNITSTGQIADLTFNNLTIGKRYRYEAKLSFNRAAGADAYASVVHNGVAIDNLGITDPGSVGALENISMYCSGTFVAASTTIFINNTSGGTVTIEGGAGVNPNGERSRFSLYEADDLAPTTDWT